MRARTGTIRRELGTIRREKEPAVVDAAHVFFSGVGQRFEDYGHVVDLVRDASHHIQPYKHTRFRRLRTVYHHLLEGVHVDDRPTCRGYRLSATGNPNCSLALSASVVFHKVIPIAVPVLRSPSSSGVIPTSRSPER